MRDEDTRKWCLELATKCVLHPYSSESILDYATKFEAYVTGTSESNV